MKKLIYFTLFFLFLVGEIFSQNIAFKKQNYLSGKIMRSDFKKIDASSIIIGKDSVYYYDFLTSKNQTTAFSDINYLRLPEGNNAGLGAGIGALTSLVIVLRAVANVSSSPNLRFKSNAVEISAGIIAGGTAIGGLLGAASPRWRTYYLGNQKTGSLHLSPKLYFSPNSFGLGINCNISSNKVVR